VFKSAGIAVLAMGLAACSAPHPQPSAPTNPSAPPHATQASAGPSLPAPGNYRIDTGSSELRLLVYRAGPLSSLGHNHVMVSRAVSGSVQLADSLPASSFSLTVPATSFVVDDAQSRREEGGDFPGEIPDDAKSGTRDNMLSPAVLDAAKFPLITVKGAALSGAQGMLTAALTIEVAGHVSTVAAPFTLQGDSHGLTASGSLELRQTAIGLTPFSVLLGALQVQDAMRVKFKIVILMN
jgi:hypothetical protein